MRCQPCVLALAISLAAPAALAQADRPALEPGVYAKTDDCGRVNERVRWDGERMVAKGGACVWDVRWARAGEHGLRQTCSTPGPRPVRRDVGEVRMRVSDPAAFILATTNGGETSYRRCIAR